MLEFLDSVNLQDMVDQQKETPISVVRTKPVSALREHRAALEIPTSTLQVININGLRNPNNGSEIKTSNAEA
jgi:Rrf2 family transcriptional regulator, iron-sulfur cluster assembly transcription factor